MTHLLEATGVSLRFGAVTAFSEVSFSVDDDELFAVIGPNGAGKTSLFNVLSRVYRPTAGEIRYRGADMRRLRTRELASNGIARTFQNLGLFPSMTVLENVLVGRHHLMRSGPVRGGIFWGTASGEERQHRAQAMEALEFAGIAAQASLTVAVLPYGIRKRVELARALAMEPSLLLLDEPVAGMTTAERHEVTDLVRRIHRERRIAILLVEHDMGMVMQVAQRVLVLDFGRVIACGTPAEVQRDQAVIRAYLGEPLGLEEAG